MLKAVVSNLRSGTERRPQIDQGIAGGEIHAADNIRATRWSRLLWSATFFSRTEYQLLLAICVLSAIYSVLFPESFATRGNVANMASVASILFVVAIGQSFALVVGGLDISVGANMGFVSIVAALFMTEGGSLVAGVAFALLAGTLVGVVNGILVARVAVTPFIATLGVMTCLSGLSDQLSHGGSIAVLPAALGRLGRDSWGPVPSAPALAVGVCCIAWLLLRRSRAGLYIFAIGGSRETARLSGISVPTYEALAYALCGFFASVAGIMLTSRVATGQGSLGQGYELQSIATAVIGGTAIGGGVGRLTGVLLGVVLMTVLTTGLDIAGINAFFQQIITGLVLIGAVIVAQARGKTRWRWQELFWRQSRSGDGA
jgi:ribose/xylose/arabinose/galactoside ABC-type transport system permease subunit